MSEVILQNKLKLNTKRKTVQRIRNQAGIHTKKNCHKTWKMQMVTKSSFYEQIKTTWSTCNIETTLITITRYFQNLLVLLLDILRTLHGMLLRHAFPCCLLLSSSSSTSSSSSGQNAFFNRPRKPLSSSQAVLVPWKNWRAKRWS